MGPKVPGIAALVLLAVPTVAEPAPPALGNPDYEEPAAPWTDLDDATASDIPTSEQKFRVDEARTQVCRDTITHARAQAGLPMVQRKTATPNDPELIYAVDRRQEGCSVMVMAGNPDDIRPLPKPYDGPLLREIPAKLDQ